MLMLRGLIQRARSFLTEVRSSAHRGLPGPGYCWAWAFLQIPGDRGSGFLLQRAWASQRRHPPRTQGPILGALLRAAVKHVVSRRCVAARTSSKFYAASMENWRQVEPEAMRLAYPGFPQRQPTVTKNSTGAESRGGVLVQAFGHCAVAPLRFRGGGPASALWGWESGKVPADACRLQVDVTNPRSSLSVRWALLCSVEARWAVFHVCKLGCGPNQDILDRAMSAYPGRQQEFEVRVWRKSPKSYPLPLLFLSVVAGLAGPVPLGHEGPLRSLKPEIKYQSMKESIAIFPQQRKLWGLQPK